jgi:hypothetical protein
MKPDRCPVSRGYPLARVRRTLDPAFDTDGKLTIDFFNSRDGARTVAMQPDGRIVLGGFAVSGAAITSALVRINP